jgi:hypothetical protein
VGDSRRFSFSNFSRTYLECILLNSFANKGSYCLVIIGEGLTLTKERI